MILNRALESLGYRDEQDFELYKDPADGIVKIRWFVDPTHSQSDIDTAEIEQGKVLAYEKVKAEARLRIINGTGISIKLPEWKQMNIAARISELLDKKIDGTLTTDESDELTAAKGIWDQVKTIRSASDDIEADIGALTLVADIEAAIVGIPSNSKWP